MQFFQSIQIALDCPHLSLGVIDRYIISIGIAAEEFDRYDTQPIEQLGGRLRSKICIPGLYEYRIEIIATPFREPNNLDGC